MRSSPHHPGGGPEPPALRNSRTCLSLATLHRKTHFDNVPVKPQRVYEEMNQVFGKDTCPASQLMTCGPSTISAAATSSMPAMPMV